MNTENNLKLDDSGYNSPAPKGSTEAFEKKIHFFVKPNSSNPGGDTVIASKEDALADALIQKYPKKRVKNMLVWAIIRDHAGLKCVNPFLLPCGFIQPETEVEIQEKNEVVYNYEMQLENTKPYSKLQSSVFFVSISDRKKKRRAITKVHYTDLRFDDVCVFASPCQNYKEAMIKDSRFINVDHFTLRRKIAGGQGATIAINEKPADLGEEIVLEVIVNRAVQSTDGKRSATPLNTSNYPMTSTSGSTSGVDPAEQSVSKSPRKKRDFNKLTDKLWEENAVYVFSKDVDDLTNEEILDEMRECLRARAWCTLVGPQDRGEKKYEKYLKKHAKVQFANHSVISRPVTFSRTIVGFYNSIGFLKCGGITATCFLVSSDMIVTSWHVVNDIRLARRSSTPHDHTEVFINFDYEKKGRPPSNGHKLRPLSYELNVICESFDYAFLTLEDCVKLENKDRRTITLGEFVRCKVPEEGKVCVVGHPGGQEKQDELCLILPVHEDRRSLEIERRLAETEQRDQPSASTFYMYRSKIRKLYGDRTALTYDVGGMFEGSSGAPVLDMKCNIVALHTLGFRLGDTSIVEVGVTFKSIIQNLEASGHSDFVRKYFPKCWNNDKDENIDEDEDEAMDEDEVEEEDMDDDIFGNLC